MAAPCMSIPPCAVDLRGMCLGIVVAVLVCAVCLNFLQDVKRYRR